MLGERNIPRWGILTTDLLITVFSILMAWLLRFNFEIEERYYNRILIDVPLILVVRAITFIAFQTYAGIIQYTSTEDARRIFFTVLTGSLALGVIDLITVIGWEFYIIPRAVLIIDFILAMLMMTSFRVFIKIMYTEVSRTERNKSYVIIYGGGESGLVAKKTLNRDRGTKYKVLAFIDDDEKLAGKRIDGIMIHPTVKLDDLLGSKGADVVIISGDESRTRQKSNVIETCLRHKVRVLNVPPMDKWINGELSFRQIKKVRIEDLLGRDPIQLDEQQISKEIGGKVILVTGAAGSIGSEIARQCIRYNPKQLILLDKAETDLFELDLQLLDNYHFKNYEMVMGDVRNEQRMENVFNTFKPDIVFHAAAYKHVPMMEHNPSEAVLNNVQGTRVIANLAVKYAVDRMVLVSTDKAVNPTSVMGASKRIAEIYVQSLSKELKKDGKDVPRFITTRFGNVLGSNGSVIPLFRKQIEAGGPVTVTHPDITRYFMTIPEACQLVLEAGSMGDGGEIFIFDMGESVKIVDLAKKMIQLSGLELGKDIQIEFSGLRPGEKLYEELLNIQENTKPTHHPKIMVASVREYTFEEINRSISDLVGLFEGQNNSKLVGKMKEIVPEYLSQNSEYESLDAKSIRAKLD